MLTHLIIQRRIVKEVPMTIDAAVAIFASIMASGGFLGFCTSPKVASAKKQSAATEKVLLGVAHGVDNDQSQGLYCSWLDND